MLVEKVFQHKISHFLLWEFYKANGVEWKTGKAIYRKEQKEQKRLKQERFAFARLLSKLLDENVPIIFMDETTVNTWQMKTKSWSTKNDIVYHTRPSTRLGVTVFGAIGNCLKKAMFMTAKSTNKNDYLNFMRQVSQQVRPDPQNRKPVLLYDAHRAHTSLDARALIPKLFNPLPIPTYSCEFNSIEKVWSFAKVQWKKQMLASKVDIKSMEQLVQRVTALFNDLDKKALHDLFYANRAYLLKTLNEADLYDN
jgi:hypothetical protein